MIMKKIPSTVVFCVIMICLTAFRAPVGLIVLENAPQDTILYPEEKHFSNIQQLTFGGDNAEAYWSYR